MMDKVSKRTLGVSKKDMECLSVVRIENHLRDMGDTGV